MTVLEKKGRIAVFVVGFQNHLVMQSKVKNIVGEQARRGWDVDFYVRIESNAARALNRTGAGGIAAANFSSQIRNMIEHAGGTLVHMDLLDKKEEVDEDFPANKTTRLGKYSPYTSETGKNVLRRFKSIEALVEIAVNRAYYNFVLVTKDDEHWLGVFKLRHFTQYDNLTHRVFSKNCITNGGINDRTLLFGRQAFHRVLPKLYTDFWMPSERLDNTTNVEEYLQEFMKIKGIISTPVSFYELPTADSIFVLDPMRGPRLCQKKRYLCIVNPNVNAKRRHELGQQDLEQPKLCPHTLNTPSD